MSSTDPPTDEPKKQSADDTFHKFSSKVAFATGTSFTFVAALTVVAVWAMSGPIFHFSDTWQLVINTGTTIITFLMVFLIQNTQNRDSRAMHLKIDELIRATRRARNVFMDLDTLSSKELDALEHELRMHNLKRMPAEELKKRALIGMSSAPPPPVT